MNKLYIFVALVAAFARADDEPFSIGLGVLSPSYSQTVGKENVKVNFQQKDDGFSYSVGDPKSGTNTFLRFGSESARKPAANPTGYANANPSGYAGANPSGYAGVNPSGYAGANPSSGYAGANPSGYAGANPFGYAGVNPSGYANANPSGYANANPSGYANANPSGYANANPSNHAGAGPLSYGGPASGYDQPSAGAHGSSSYGPAGQGYSGSYGIGSYEGPNSNAPHSYIGVESARKPEQPGQIIPAGFSYHGTDGQSFLNQESPNFMVSDGEDSARGPAEKSFVDNFGQGQDGNRKFLVNGLVGYGPGGQRKTHGSLGVGEYAGPQYGGVFREHGGHE